MVARVLVVLALGLAVPAQGGRVTGTIRFEGEVPKLTVPDDLGRLRPLLTVQAETRGLQDVVVYAERLDGLPGEAAGGVTADSPAKLTPAVMDQKDHTFRPHVLTVRAGQRVKFTNSDAANHNVRAAALAAKNSFNTFTPAEGSYTHRFELDRKMRPIRLGCDIHPWMQAWIYVFDHDWHAVTDAGGKFQIGDLPPGRYRIVVRQPDAGFRGEREVTVQADRAAVVDWTFGPGDIAD